MGLTNIMTAMKDKNIEEQIKELIKQDKIMLVDQSNKAIFEKEIKEGLGFKR